MKWVLLAVLAVCAVRCQQWFMPDSNLISDQEYVQKVTGDNLRFKFVKYFTPHCPYCRYLKAVFDTLKHKKQWCFSIYELNCQWYPQFCMQNVKSSSFPYTVVYDQHGQVYEEIHGFYPEPIIANIFDRIQQLCLNLKTNNTPVPQHTQQPASLSAEVHHEPIATQNKQNRQHPVESTPPQQQQNPPQPRNAQQSDPGIDTEKQEVVHDHKTEASKLPPYISYAFYGICLIFAAIYIRSLHSQSPGTQQTPQSKVLQSKNVEGDCVGMGKKGQNEQDSELLEIPDDQL